MRSTRKEVKRSVAVLGVGVDARVALREEENPCEATAWRWEAMTGLTEDREPCSADAPSERAHDRRLIAEKRRRDLEELTETVYTARREHPRLECFMISPLYCG